MQKEIRREHDLLDEHGELIQTGYATSLLLNYQREHIKANPLRIKEWNYYLIMNSSFGLALTIADNSYMGMISATWLDFTKPEQITTSVMTAFPNGKMGLPSSSQFGDTTFHNHRITMRFMNDGKGTRRIFCDFKRFDKEKSLTADLILNDEPTDSMVIATPFSEDKKAFYYNQKINAMSASGTIRFNGLEYTMDPKDSLAVLDWGRGVWTYKNTWYWGSISTFVDGHKLGINMGYGFGDTTNASENMIIYRGNAHKLDQITFDIPKNPNGSDDYMSPWKFSSNDNRLQFDFEPLIDRYAKSSVVVIKSIQHQVFGYFTGRVILDDGTSLTLDHVLGFAEKVMNQW